MTMVPAANANVESLRRFAGPPSWTERHGVPRTSEGLPAYRMGSRERGSDRKSVSFVASDSRKLAC
jgi:hypothetical protein